MLRGMSDLVFVALIAAAGPIIALWAKPIADAITGFVQAGERRRSADADTAREAQAAMAAVMQRRATVEFIPEAKEARALAMAVVPIAERIRDDAAREAVKPFVESAIEDRGGDHAEVLETYRQANALLGPIIRSE